MLPKSEWDKVIQTVNAALKLRQQTARANIRKGMKVQFKDRKSQTQTGTVEKVMKKNIKVVVGRFPNEIIWTVSANLLEIV
jgi:lipopolysaccharide biosynthesis regulator YciM